jgi:glutathione S-transferase
MRRPRETPALAALLRQLVGMEGALAGGRFTATDLYGAETVRLFRSGGKRRALWALLRRGLVRRDGTGYRLTPAGAEAARASESGVTP